LLRFYSVCDVTWAMLCHYHRKRWTDRCNRWRTHGKRPSARDRQMLSCHAGVANLVEQHLQGGRNRLGVTCP